MALTLTPPTRPVVLALDPGVDRFDVLDEFRRVFWKNMTAEQTLEFLHRDTTPSTWSAVPHVEGREAGAKVEWVSA